MTMTRRREHRSTRRRSSSSGCIMIRLGREDGAIAPLMAALIAGLVLISLWAANGATLVGVKREHQRAANLSALAGAANLPLTGLLAPAEPQTTACDQAERLLTREAAPLSNELAATKAGPTCVDGVSVEGLFDYAIIERVQRSLESVLGPVQSRSLCGPLRGLIDPLLALLSLGDCNRLEAIVDGLPGNVAPAALTPKVRVTIREKVEAPVPVPGFFSGVNTLTATALARRRFKNIVVLPAVRTSALGLPQIAPGLWQGAPADPNNLNLNTTAADVRNTILPQLWRANQELASRSGGQVDFTGMLLDLEDTYNPPTGATPPSPAEIAVEAARRGEPVFILRVFQMPILGIPAFDFTAAYLSPQSNGLNWRALYPVPIADLSRANGLFGATLVRS
jgi:hypothetical protein